MPDPGRLDQRVRLEQESETPDGGGGYALGWSTVATVWGRVEPLGGRERLQAQALESSVDYKVTIRRRSDVTAGMRLVWTTNGSVALQIRDVRDPGPRGAYMELMCERGVAT